jgi:Zn-dependent oligopeptidase
MNSVANSDALEEAYNACLPKLSAYSTEMGQNEALFKAYKSIAESDEYAALDTATAQQKIIQNALRDFHLSGIDLDADKKQRYKEISQELSQLASRFGGKMLDALNDYDTIEEKSHVYRIIRSSKINRRFHGYSLKSSSCYYSDCFGRYHSGRAVRLAGDPLR